MESKVWVDVCGVSWEVVQFFRVEPDGPPCATTDASSEQVREAARRCGVDVSSMDEDAVEDAMAAMAVAEAVRKGM